MNGVLVVDKPRGLTSHDVVAIARRVLDEKQIGHTGTLDPLATGVLALACGRATRLVRFLSASDKDYEATIRFGRVTDTYDITGTVVERCERRPEPEAIEQALKSLRGEYLQVPPPYSAKKIAGRPAYALARRDRPVALKPARVDVTRAEPISLEGALLTVSITCSAGFYVRSFAHTLGQQVGTGACLERLRRTRSGEFDLDCALPFETLTGQDLAAVTQAVIPMGRLLPALPAVSVTDEGRTDVQHGRPVVPGRWVSSSSRLEPGGWARVVDADGSLLALAQARDARGSLHPSVVLI